MIEEHIKLLGQQMEDVVSGFKGTVDSVSFDLYGCVQATLKPRIDKDGNVPDGCWFDVKRLKKSGKRLMDAPAHMTTKPGKENGPADKPMRRA